LKLNLTSFLGYYYRRPADSLRGLLFHFVQPDYRTCDRQGCSDEAGQKIQQFGKLTVYIAHVQGFYGSSNTFVERFFPKYSYFNYLCSSSVQLYLVTGRGGKETDPVFAYSYRAI